MQRESEAISLAKMVLVGRNFQFCTTCTHLAVIANAGLTNTGTIAAPAKSHLSAMLFTMTDAGATMPHSLNFGKTNT